ncbi:MAG: hypothetical protein VKP57_02715 [Candidatus Sericytochromatia bacterium]|nr:hypothetical protein [Candidatus Sericytochromatia bacterium]
MARDLITGSAGTGKLPPLRAGVAPDRPGIRNSPVPAPSPTAGHTVATRPRGTGTLAESAHRYGSKMSLMPTQVADGLSALNSPNAGMDGLGSVRPQRTSTRANQALTDLMAAFAGDPATQAALAKLEASGTLDTRDSEGNSIQEQLLDLLQRPQLPGLPPNKQLVSELIDSMAHPHTIGQGEGTFTCTAATVQITLAGNNPAEYMRIMHGLLVDGTVKTIGGDTLEASLEGLAEQEGRSAIEDIFQDSVMALGNRMVAEGDERIGNGTFGKGPRRYGNDDGQGEGGLTAGQFEAIARSLTGQNLVAFEPTAEMSPARMQDLFSNLLKVGKGAVQVGMKAVDEAGNPTSHAVVVTGYRNGLVTIVDPGTGSPEVMTADEFKKRLELVFVDVGHVDRLARKVPNVPLRQSADSALARRINPSALAYARTRTGSQTALYGASRLSIDALAADRASARLGTAAPVAFRAGEVGTRNVVQGADLLTRRRRRE